MATHAFFLQFVSILIYHQLLTTSCYCQLLLISIDTKIIMSTVGCVVCTLEHLHSAISLAYPCTHLYLPQLCPHIQYQFSYNLKKIQCTVGYSQSYQSFRKLFGSNINTPSCSYYFSGRTAAKKGTMGT